MADRSLINSAMGGWQPGSAGVTIQSAMGGGQPDGPPGISLNALGLSVSYFTIGSPATVNILYATNGSAITAGFLPAGFTLSGRTITYDGNGAVGTPAIQLTESLAGVTRTTNINITVAASTGPTPPSLAQFSEGYNQEGPNYYIPVPLHNDYGRYCTIQGNVLYMPYAGITGPATVQTDGVFTGSTHSTIQSFSQSGNTVTYTVSGDATDTDARGLNFTTPPTYFQVTRTGRTGKWSTEALQGWEGRGWRDLDMTFTNKVTLGPRVDTGPADAPFYQLTDKGCLIPIEDRADFHAAKMAQDSNFFFWWNVIPGNWSMADIRAAARIQRDRCPSNAAFIIQWANEDPWNDAFPGVRTTYISAFAAGYYGAATWDVPLTPIIIKADCDSASAGNTASPASVAGDRVLFDLQGTAGRSVWRAKITVPAGAEINENQYWTREYDQNFVRDAQRKYRTRMLYDIDQIYRQEFGSRYATQIFPCMMAQHAGTGEIYNQLVLERTYIPGFFDGSVGQTVKVAGCGGYLDEANLGQTAFDYNNATPSSLDAGIRAAFVPYKTRIQQFMNDCARMKVIPGIYELSIAPVLPNSNTYKTSYQTYSRSDAYRLLMKDFGEYWRAICPGLVMFYDATGDKLTTNPSTTWNYYSLRTTWADTSNPRYVGWKQGIAITPAPTPTPTPGYEPLNDFPGLQEYFSGDSGIILNGSGPTMQRWVDGKNGMSAGAVGTISYDATSWASNRPSVSFPGNGSYFTTTVQIGSGAATLAFVCQPSGSAAFPALIGGNSGSLALDIDRASGTVRILRQGQALLGTCPLPGAVNAKHLIIVRLDGSGGWEIDADGTIATGTNAGGLGNSNYFIGYDPDGGSNNEFAGLIAAFPHGNTRLSDTDKAAFKNFAKTRWGTI